MWRVIPARPRLTTCADPGRPTRFPRQPSTDPSVRRRLIPLALLALLAILHGQLWIGRGSVPHVADLNQQLASQMQKNELARQANQQLSAEVRDLKEGMEMVEEKARLELGMVRPNEILVQVTK